MSHHRVVHVKAGGWDIYVGRTMPGHGPACVDQGWSNPYRVKEHGRSAIRLYLDMLVRHPEIVMRARRELHGKVLACWCAPRPCHGEALARLADGDSLVEIRRDLLLLTGETMDLFTEAERGSS